MRQEAGPGAERGQGQRLRGAVVVLPPILAHVLQHALLAPADPGQSGTQRLLFPLGLCRQKEQHPLTQETGGRSDSVFRPGLAVCALTEPLQQLPLRFDTAAG